jgi:uncharacterized membrane protein YeaQ/YmgE (transglycosylase-associated protein family)
VLGSTRSLGANIAIGIIGAVVAGALLPADGIGLGGGILGAVVSATIGASVVLVVARLVAG